MEAYDGDAAGGGRRAIANDDPRGEYTYGEFPFESFDLLVDRAGGYRVPPGNCGSCGKGGRSSDDGGPGIGGCGRLVFYAALARGGDGEGTEVVLSDAGSETTTWDVHSVKIGTRLHALAANSLDLGVHQGWFKIDGSSEESSSSIAFHNSNALLVEDPYCATTDSATSNMAIQSLLSKTDILFAYSAVWVTSTIQPFDPGLGAMILSPKWSQTLAKLCPSGCVAVTTDRALNPEDGWKLADRMDVENPRVWGSVVYVSLLEK